MTRPTLYAAAGGAPAMRVPAADFHARCLADPVLEHPFAHTDNPEHVVRLADYWGEVLGGPPVRATDDVMAYSPKDAVVPPGLTVPRGDWDGLRPG